MKGETKLFIGIAFFTVALIVGAMYMLGRPTPPQPPQQADPTILIRADSNTVATGSAVTLVEFGDYQCPACGTYHGIVKQLLEEFKEDVTFVFRHFPLENIHKNARMASAAVEAA